MGDFQSLGHGHFFHLLADRILRDAQGEMSWELAIGYTNNASHRLERNGKREAGRLLDLRCAIQLHQHFENFSGQRS